jgi:hypothetical protein
VSLLANEVAARRVCVEPGHGPLVELTWAVLLERARTHIPLHAARPGLGLSGPGRHDPEDAAVNVGGRDHGTRERKKRRWLCGGWIAGCFRVS